MNPATETQNEIEKEYAAIEQGCFALIYMLRKMRDVSMAIAMIRSYPNGEMDPILDNLLKEDLGAIRHARKGIGHLIEDTGNFMDGTDMNADMDLRPADLAYEFHQAFPDNLDPKWASYGAEEAAPGATVQPQARPMKLRAEVWAKDIKVIQEYEIGDFLVLRWDIVGSDARKAAEEIAYRINSFEPQAEGEAE